MIRAHTRLGRALRALARRETQHVSCASILLRLAQVGSPSHPLWRMLAQPTRAYAIFGSNSRTVVPDPNVRPAYVTRHGADANRSIRKSRNTRTFGRRWRPAW